MPKADESDLNRKESYQFTTIQHSNLLITSNRI